MLVTARFSSLGRIGPLFRQQSYHTFTEQYKRMNTICGDWQDALQAGQLRSQAPIKLHELPVTTLNRYYNIYRPETLPSPVYQTSARTMWLLTCGHQTYRLVHNYFFNWATCKKELAEICVDNGVVDDPDIHTHATLKQRIELTQHKQNGKLKPLPFIEELFFKEKNSGFTLIKRAVNSHNTRGHLVVKKVYDANQHLTGEYIWERDAAGQITKKITPTESVHCVYDDKGNLVEEQNINTGVTRRNVYDKFNQLTFRCDVDLSGTQRIWHYKHNLHFQDGMFQGETTVESESYCEGTTRYFNSFGEEYYTELPRLTRSNGSKLKRFIHRVDNIDQAMYLEKGFKARYPHEHHEVIFYDKRKMFTFGPRVSREFDEIGRMVAQYRHNARRQIIQATRYEYEGYRVVSERHSKGNKWTDQWTFHHDSEGSVVQELLNNELKYSYTWGPNKRMLTKTVYTEEGAQETRYTYAGPGSLKSSSIRLSLAQEEEEALKPVTTEHYDGWKRLVKVTRPVDSNNALVPFAPKET